MPNKHQRHLAKQKRRALLKEMNTETVEVEVTPTTNTKEPIVHNHIQQAKGFFGRHKKAFIIVGSIAAVAVAAVVAHKVIKTGKLVELVGDAALVNAKVNTSTMTPDLVATKIRLMKNPGTVVVKANENKMYALLYGNLISVNYDVKGMTQKALSNLYLASWNEGFGGDITAYLYSKDAS